MVPVSVRVLTIDDFEAWRRFVSSTLKNDSRFRIIGEASDGSEAVRKAQELRPDLIVLDIGLPKVNGIEAARQIRKVAPKSKILFLTDNSSPEIAAEALGTGANGYVVKRDAGSELLTAVEAVLHGNPFVSSSLAFHDPTETTDVQSFVRPTMNAD
jgi:DNA-binding NarL/FixJ family response regulator